MAKVIIYTTPTCPYCEQAKEYLRGKGLSFEEVNVADDLSGRQEMMMISGQMGVPVIRIDNVVVIGFNRNSIDHALSELSIKEQQR
ncbi:MAG: glutaredoxin domain-containing protein [bacterium]|nr:glutaredoxin domain-containing protein [bacterium]